MKGFEQTLTMTSIKDIIKLMYALFSGDASSKWRLSVKPWTKKRSLPANSQQHIWYAQIANKQGYASDYVKDVNKIMFGVDVLLGSDSAMAQRVVRTLEMVDFWDREWLVKIDIISGLQVTSLFNTTESKIYMDRMIQYWNELGYPIKYKDQ